ncbi:hypothetical protein ACQPW1_22665 [Nocardia sp. CA-128927]|uniref:hypothetical protein n=1 Tax=Nocardia sp. CA-128927 TaxID=3239975 RepID=UPI003D960EA3
MSLPIGGNVQALLIGEHWGRQLKEQLGLSGIAGPVVAHPYKRQAFLANGPLDAAQMLRDYLYAMYRSNSMLAPPGRPLVLPTPGNGRCGWDLPVRDHFRPALSSVLAALHACVEREDRKQIGEFREASHHIQLPR